MEKTLAQWFVYNCEANQKIIEIVRDAAPQKAKAFLGHILISHRIWIDRIDGRAPHWKPWDELPEEQFDIFNKNILQDTLALLDRPDVLQMEINYSNTKGQAFTNTVSDILFHLLTHSAYHRGQVNQAMRQAQMEPALTDFIFYSRDGRL